MARAARRAVALLAAGALGLGACGRADEGEAVARARAALAPFKQELRATLRAALAQGPEAAITACAERAPAIAAKHSVGGIALGRASARLRSPRNEAAPWVMQIARGGDAGEARVIALDGGRVGYTEPIEVEAPCVMCHGREIAPEIRARIAALYPEDRATGYAVGDVRGVFWVELPAR